MTSKPNQEFMWSKKELEQDKINRKLIFCRNVPNPGNEDGIQA